MAQIDDLAVHRKTPPEASEYYASVWGAENQWRDLNTWLGNGKSARTHASLFGSTLCQLGYEALCAATVLSAASTPRSRS